jgi:mRNA interferase RelE/StbE
MLPDRRFTVRLLPAAQRDYDKLPDNLQRRIFNRMRQLEQEPHPRQSIKLQVSAGVFRLRVGDYRLLYRISRREKQINISRIAHRREVYK